MMTIAIIELISAVFLGILLVGQISERSELKSGKYLRNCTFLMLISLISDGLAYVIQEPYVPFPLVYLNCMLAYTAGGINSLGLAWYSEAYIAEKIKLNPLIFRIFKIVGVIWIAAVVQAFLAGKLVVFENGLEVAYYSFPPILSAYQIVVMLYVPVVVFLYRNELGREAVILLSALSASPILGLLATPVTGENYSYVFGAIALFLVFGFLQRKRQTAIIRSLAGEYTALFHVSLDSGIFTTNTVSERVPDIAERISRHEKFADFFHDLADSPAVYEEDREKVQAMYPSDAAVRKALAHKKSLRVCYRRKYGEKYLWNEMNIIKDEAVDDEPVSVAVGIIEKDAEIRREQENQAVLEEALFKANKEAERNGFLYDMMNATKWSSDFNAAGEVVATHYSEGVYEQTKTQPSGEDALSWVQCLYPEDRAHVRDAFMAAIKDRTGQTKYDVTFRLLGTDGKDRWIKTTGRTVRRSDGSGEIFGMNVDLTEEIEKERENYSRMLALEDDFEALYDVELGTGVYGAFIKGKAFNKALRERLLNTADFFSDLQENILAAVYPADQQALLDILNAQALCRELAEQAHIDHFCRLMVDDKPVWFKVRAVYKDAAKENIIIGVFNAEAEVAAKNQAEQERKNLIAQMSGGESLYIINRETGRFQILGQNEYLAQNYNSSSGTFTESFTRYIKTDVFESDRKMVTEKITVAAMDSQLENIKEYIVQYRDISSGAPRWYEMRAVRLSDSEILCGFIDKDNEIILQHLNEAERAENIAVFAVDLDNGTLKVIKKNPWDDAYAEGAVAPYSEVIRHIGGKYDGHVGEFYEIIGDAEKLRAFLAQDYKHTFSYRSEFVVGDKWINIAGYVVARNEDGSPSAAVLCYSFLDTMGRDRAEMQEKIEQSLTFTSFFLKSYVSAYYIGLDDLSFQVYKRTAHLDEEYPVIPNYIESLGKFIDQEVHPDDREQMKNILLRPQKIKELLAEKTEFYFDYRLISGPEERIRRTVVIRGADEAHAAFGFRDVTDEIQSQIQQQKTKEAVNSFANDYVAAFMVDLTDDSYSEISGRDIIFNKMTDIFTFSEKIKRYMERYTHPADRKSFDVIGYSPEDVKKELKVGESVSIEYRSNYKTGEYIWHRMGISRVDENTVLVGFKDCDNEILSGFVKEKLLGKYDALYYVDLNENIVRPVHTAGASSVGSFSTTLRYSETVKLFADTVAPRYKQDWLNFGNAEYMRKYMADTDRREFIYELPEMKKILRRCTIDVVDRVDGNAATIFLAFEGIDDLQAQTILMNQRLAEQSVQLKEALAQAESASAAKTEFLFNMSHDIRTPMNAILGYTDAAIRHFDDTERTKESLKKIKNSGEHLLSLINDILEMSRIESGTLEITEKPLDIRDGIEEVRQMGEALAVSKHINFSVESGEIRNPYIYADELHFNEVLLNIITNAIKYTNEGGSVKYSISQLSDAEEGKAWYRFAIADTGIGMSEEFQEHIFETFSRERTSTVSKQEGVGLGMAIVKRIVDKMNGRIEIKSKLGEGTTVIIEAPFNVMDDAAAKEFIAKAETGETTEGNVTLEGKKVLLVEDNEMNREIAAEILKDSGLIVDTAEDGDIAVRMVYDQVGCYDYILMDIQMPVMNGYEATRAIRKLPGGNSIPIIAVSANAFDEDKKKSFEAGMNDHIAKPIDVQVLLETLQKWAK